MGEMVIREPTDVAWDHEDAVLSDVEVVGENLTLASAAGTEERYAGTLTRSGSRYAWAEQRIIPKANLRLWAAYYYHERSSGTITLTIVDSVTAETLATVEKTISAAGWEPFVMPSPVALVADRTYNFRWTFSASTRLWRTTSFLYDGTLWKTTSNFISNNNSYPETMGIGLVPAEYAESGYRTSPGLDMTSAGLLESSRITWTATTPSVATLVVSAAVTGGDPPGTEDWTVLANGDPVPDLSLEADLTGKYLWLKQELSTTNPAISPVLVVLRVEINAVTNIPLYLGSQQVVAVYLGSTEVTTLCLGGS